MERFRLASRCAAAFMSVEALDSIMTRWILAGIRFGTECRLRQRAVLSPVLVLSTLLCSLQAEELNGVYRIRAKASAKYLHVHAGPDGDKLASTRFQTNDESSLFIVKHIADGFHTIHVKANKEQIRVADQRDGDKLVSVRPVQRDPENDPLDRYGKFLFKRQLDNSYRIRLLTGGWLLVGNDQLVRSGRVAPNDPRGRFELIKATEGQMASPSKQIAVVINNPTRYPAEVQRLNDSAAQEQQRKVTYQPGQTRSLLVPVGSQWKYMLKTASGSQEGRFVIKDQPNQTIRLGSSPPSPLPPVGQPKPVSPLKSDTQPKETPKKEPAADNNPFG